MTRQLAFLFALWIPLLTAAGDPGSLQLRIVEGDGAVYPPGSRSTRGITVEVSDDTGKLVEGATVSFGLPDDGPSGLFANKSRIEIVTTGRDGRAAAWGMQWNRLPGPFEVRITATKGDARAGTVCSQSLTASLPARSEPSSRRVGGGHKWLWIALGVAGGAGAAVVLAGRAGAGSTSESTAVSATSIGSPTISIGHQ